MEKHPWFFIYANTKKCVGIYNPHFSHDKKQLNIMEQDGFEDIDEEQTLVNGIKLMCKMGWYRVVPIVVPLSNRQSR